MIMVMVKLFSGGYMTISIHYLFAFGGCEIHKLKKRHKKEKKRKTSTKEKIHIIPTYISAEIEQQKPSS